MKDKNFMLNMNRRILKLDYQSNQGSTKRQYYSTSNHFLSYIQLAKGRKSLEGHAFIQNKVIAYDNLPYKYFTEPDPIVFYDYNKVNSFEKFVNQ